MLRVDCSRWEQNAQTLREEALKATHPRSRERLMALYEISQGKSATKVGQETKRHPQTIMGWVHQYNTEGSGRLFYQHSGGHPPLLSLEIEQGLDEQIRNALKLSATPPQQRTEQMLPRWTLKRLVEWVKTKFNISCCRQTIRSHLKKLGLSWKKARKLLNKANPQKRAEYLEQLQGLLERALQQEELVTSQ